MLSKKKKAIIEALTEREMYWEAYKLENCMKIGLVVRCDKCGRQLHTALRCDLRICPECSARQLRRLVRRFFPLVKRLMASNGRNTVKFLTLTVVNNRELRSESIQTLFKNARKLMREFFDKKAGAGAIAVLEVGKNLNLHIHLLVYGPFVLQKRLSERWAELTRDSFVVDIRRAWGNPRYLLNYVLGYIAKPCSFEDPEYYADYLTALKRVRRVHTFGIFYNLGKMVRNIVRCICGGRFCLDRSFYEEYGMPTLWKLKWFFGIPSILKAI